MLVIPMSSSGYCPRALSAQLLSYPTKPKPDWLTSSAEEGNLHEDAIKAKLRGEGFQIDDNRSDCIICKTRYGTGRKGIHVEIQLTAEILLVGHLDGLINADYADYDSILECKSMSQNQFDKWMTASFVSFPHYADQLTCYMKAKGIFKSLYCVKNRNNGILDRVNLIEAPSNWNIISERLIAVGNSVLQKKLVEVEYNPSSTHCQMCFYPSLCEPVQRPLQLAEAKELTELLEIRDKNKRTISELQGLVSYEEIQIKSQLIKIGQNKVKVAGWNISLSRGVTTTTYSKEALINAGVTEQQLERAKKVSEPYDRLYLKNNNQEE